MRPPRVLAMIMAGGKGERLMPLTEERSKPAVPFGGQYRIIDFVLSNFLNSGILSIYVLVQYRSQSLIDHLRRAWRIGGRIKQHFITVVPPQMKVGEGWYAGTADAVFHNLNLIEDLAPDLVAVFGADHIYRMDIGQMVQFHLDREAEVTVAARPVPIRTAHAFGIIETDRDGRILGFEEKPKSPNPMPSDPESAYSSMGNYLFRTETLLKVLAGKAGKPGARDFGADVLPSILGPHRVMAYDFMHNLVPGVEAYEEQGYWRDVGTIDAYWQAHMDLLGSAPKFALRNAAWPILGDTFDAPPASITNARLEEVLIGQGSLVGEANIRRSVIGRNVRIEGGAQIDECIILDGCTIGAQSRLSRAIVDRFNRLPSHSVIDGRSPRDDTRWHRTRSQLVVLPRQRTRMGQETGVPELP